MQENLDRLCEWIHVRFGEGPDVAAGVVGVALLLGLFLHHVVLRGVLALLRRTATDLDEKVLRALQGPIVATVLLAGVFLAVYLLGLDFQLARTFGRIVLTMLLGLWSVQALRISAVVLRYASTRADRFPLVESRTYPLFANLSTVLLLGLAAYLFLVVWDIDATGWLASAGIVGVAVGFAAKDTLSNLFAGVFIVADAPYRIGDYIVLEDGVRGQVVHIGLRSTRILTRDDVEITVPNAIIGTTKIVNQSGGGATSMRVRVPVGVSYEADPELVKRCLLEIATAEEGVLADPEPRVRFRRFGDSALEFELLVWVPDPSLRGRTVDALLTKTLARFRAEGVAIPFPQRDVHIVKE